MTRRTGIAGAQPALIAFSLAVAAALAPAPVAAKMVDKELASVPAAETIVIRGFSGVVRLETHASISGLEGAIQIHGQGDAARIGAIEAEEDRRRARLVVTAQPQRGFFRRSVADNCKLPRDLKNTDVLTILVPPTEKLAIELDTVDAHLDFDRFTGTLEISESGISGEVEDIDALSVEAEVGCGLDVGHVARALELDVTGKGPVEVTGVGGEMLLRTADYKGKVEIARLEARFDGTVNGGEIEIEEGYASAFHLNFAGSGGFEFGGTAVSPVVLASDPSRIGIKRCEGTTENSPQNAAATVCGR